MPFDEDSFREEYLQRIREEQERSDAYPEPIGPGLNEAPRNDPMSGVAPSDDPLEDSVARSARSGPPLMSAGNSQLWHNHHVYPREFIAQFRARGINIDLYTVRIPRDDHFRVHREVGGGLWNAEWTEFFNQNPNAARGQIQYQASEMIMRHN